MVKPGYCSFKLEKYVVLSNPMLYRCLGLSIGHSATNCLQNRKCEFHVKCFKISWSLPPRYIVIYSPGHFCIPEPFKVRFTQEQ